MRPLVLIVDDDPEFRFLIIESLKRHFNAKWIEASSGQEALKLLQENFIALVISDFNMPNGSGTWLHQQMNIQMFQVPLILFTSELFNVKVAQPFLDQTLRAVIPKISIDELSLAVKKFI